MDKFIISRTQINGMRVGSAKRKRGSPIQKHPSKEQTYLWHVESFLSS